MTWFYLILGSGILISITNILEKKILVKEHALEYSGVISILNTLFSLPLLFFVNYSTLHFLPILYLFFITMTSALAFVLIAKSTRHMEVSSVSPMLNMSTGVTALLSFLILGEVLTRFQVLGIIMLIVGSYVLQTHHEESIFDPIKRFVNSKYLHFILIAIVCYGIDSIYDRFALTHYQIDPLGYLVIAHLFISFHLIMAMNTFYNGWSGIKKGMQNMHWWVIGISIITVIQRVMHIFATSMAYVGLVVAVKRSSSLFTVLLAGELFHEKNIIRKLLASAILIAGVVLIVIK